jgi:hypothetical protein
MSVLEFKQASCFVFSFFLGFWSVKVQVLVLENSQTLFHLHTRQENEFFEQKCDSSVH